MHSEQVAWGINAYQTRDYETAVAYLEQADRNDWTGQLYLGMSYFLLDKIDECQRVFFRIKDECPDREIRSKAEAAFLAVRGKLRQAAERERELAAREQREEEEEVEW